MNRQHNDPPLNHNLNLNNPESAGDPKRPEKGKPLYQAETKENESSFAI